MRTMDTSDLKKGCRERGCLEPIAGIARLCRAPEGAESTYKGRVWGGWTHYCLAHLDELPRDQFRVAYDRDPLIFPTG